MLVIHADFEELLLLFDPTVDKLKDCIEDALMRGMSMLLNNELLIQSQDFIKYTKSVDEFEERIYEEETELL